MAHTINYNSETNVIELSVRGEIFLSEQKEIFTEAIRMSKDKNCNMFLSDYSKATLKISTFEIYELPKYLTSIVDALGINVHLLKRAIIVAKDLDDYLFFETVTANNKQTAKVFTDVDEAKKWLFNK